MKKDSLFLLTLLLAVGVESLAIHRPEPARLGAREAVIQQPPKEFEGRVHFTNHYVFKRAGIDSAAVVRGFGSSSVYAYKKGRYKWVSRGGDFQYEWYDGGKGLLLEKYAADTLFKLNIEKGDSLVSYAIQQNAVTICGYRCDAIHLHLLSGTDQQPIRRSVYYAKQLYINPAYFKPYRDYANDKVYALTKSLPLRIVMEFGGLPVEITIDATKVESTLIADNELQLDKSLYIK